MLYHSIDAALLQDDDIACIAAAGDLGGSFSRRSALYHGAAAQGQCNPKVAAEATWYPSI